MRRYLLILAILGLAALEAPGRAAADTITYVETATASGTLDGVAFTNQTLTLTGVGDPAAVFSTGPGRYSNHVTLTASVGATTDQLSGTSSAQGSRNGQTFGFLDSGGGDILSTAASAYASYDLTTAIGPVVGSLDNSEEVAFATTRGTLEITSVTGNVTVTATVGAAVPEPTSFVLAAIGITAVTGYQFRRRKLAGA